MSKNIETLARIDAIIELMSNTLSSDDKLLLQWSGIINDVKKIREKKLELHQSQNNTIQNHNNLSDFKSDILPLARFCEHYKIKKGTIYSYISRKHFPEGKVYFKDPLNHIHISISGWEKWVTGNYTEVKTNVKTKHEKRMKNANNNRRNLLY